jgi:iron-sulfur cluster repair protein YtfE (RIC family)
VTYDIETPSMALRRRAAIPGEVDFTMMYVAHDAFNRDLARLLTAADAGTALSPAAVATWQSFSTQLHTHHTAEDISLWPRLQELVSDPTESRIIEDMQQEHASLDPRLQHVDAAIAAGDEGVLAEELRALGTGLPEHMRHEEEAALPLLERRLGQAGWDAFGAEIRRQQGGIKGAAEYVPWVLDSANPAYAATFLRLLPGPARLLYRRIWEPRYRHRDRLR